MNCPDCGKHIDKVLVERYSHMEFDVNHEQKVITPMPNHDWEHDDHACRCPHCDTLNLDFEMREYSLADGMRSLM